MPLATAESYLEMLEAARTRGFALPGVAVTSSETLNAALRGFADAGSDGIVQVSPSAGTFASGTAVGDMARGALALAAYAEAVADKYPVQIALHTDHCRAQHVDSFLLPLLRESARHRARRGRPLFNSQMFDGSDLPMDENLAISVRLLEQTHAADVVLEIEVGVVGAPGSGDGDSDSEREGEGEGLTQPEQFVEVVRRLGAGERGRYIFAPAFGNVHGIAPKGARRVDTGILLRGQEAVRRVMGLPHPLYLAFHGGSGSSTAVVREAIRCGVVKFNVDTDTQYAFSHAIVDYVAQHHSDMVGSEDTPPSKAAFDTRSYLRNAEVSMAAQVTSICEEVLSAGQSLGRG